MSCLANLSVDLILLLVIMNLCDASCVGLLIGVCGKKAYISPEVLAGHRSIKLLQIDIWALGIMLFMCLTGMPPVDSAVSSDARYRVIVAGR